MDTDMDDDDDFTFPTTAAAAPPPVGDAGGLPLRAAEKLLLAGATATSTSSPPLWPFSFSGTARQTSTTAAQDDVGQASASPPAPEGSGAQVVGRPHAGAAAEDQREKWERERADAASKEERMDVLWEDFNAKELLRRARSGTAAAANTHLRGEAPDEDGQHSSSEETEASASASASGRRYGCAPAMLRASSRAAGGPGQQLYRDGSGRRRRSGRAATGWALLLRLFRRLLAVDDAPPCQPRRHGSIYVP